MAKIYGHDKAVKNAIDSLVVWVGGPPTRTSYRIIGTIKNYYADVSVRKEGEKAQWSINNFDGDDWQEIPQYLYDALNRFQDEQEAKK